MKSPAAASRRPSRYATIPLSSALLPRFRPATAYHAMAPTARSATSPTSGATQLERARSGGTAVGVPSNRSRPDGSSGPSGVYAAAFDRCAPAAGEVDGVGAALAPGATGAGAGAGSPINPASSLTNASRDALTSPSVGL